MILQPFASYRQAIDCRPLILGKAVVHESHEKHKFKGLNAANEYPMGESPSQCNLLFYFVPFVFFVDELPFLG